MVLNLGGFLHKIYKIQKLKRLCLYVHQKMRIGWLLEWNWALAKGI